MPITPLHLGLAVPFFNKPKAVAAFFVPNLLLDADVIAKVLLGPQFDPTPLHSSHTIAAALFTALISWAFFRTRWGLAAALYGAFSHILLDALVHSDVPLWNGTNPIYMGWYDGVNLMMIGLLCFGVVKLARDKWVANGRRLFV